MRRIAQARMDSADGVHEQRGPATLTGCRADFLVVEQHHQLHVLVRSQVGSRIDNRPQTLIGGASTSRI